MRVFLWIVMIAFCGMLLVTYLAARHASPVMLDSAGRPFGAVEDR